ncbi:MAG: recombinase RecA [Proteobacteria bacterium]|jgi:recombination protein RecA|nr:recombinase RecA [Pseudomonadota bacterium]
MAREPKESKEIKEKDIQSSKDKAIEQAISAIEKQFGKGSIMRLGSTEQVAIPTIPSGSIALDLALGIGGFPRGRVIEIYGPEASGKTTVALHAVAESQKAGGVAAFIDAEHALDVQYARRMGVDIDNLLICQPDYGEQALEIADMLVRSNSVDIVVIDSVAALVPRAELEGDMGDAHVGLQARLMSQALRKLTATSAKSKTALVFINQLRTKVGIMFGNPETTSGGNALKFYSSVRLDVRKVSLIKNGQDVIGQRSRIKVVKNKMAPPFREVEVDIIYGQGINREGDVLDLAVALNIVDKSGAWYSFEGERLGNGREACKALLADNPTIMTAIENRIRESKNLPLIEEFLASHDPHEDDEGQD